jgi:hypothetical protein
MGDFIKKFNVLEKAHVKHIDFNMQYKFYCFHIIINFTYKMIHNVCITFEIILVHAGVRLWCVVCGVLNFKKFIFYCN